MQHPRGAAARELRGAEARPPGDLPVHHDGQEQAQPSRLRRRRHPGRRPQGERRRRALDLLDDDRRPVHRHVLAYDRVQLPDWHKKELPEGVQEEVLPQLACFRYLSPPPALPLRQDPQGERRSRLQEDRAHLRANEAHGRQGQVRHMHPGLHHRRRRQVRQPARRHRRPG